MLFYFIFIQNSIIAFSFIIWPKKSHNKIQIQNVLIIMHIKVFLLAVWMGVFLSFLAIDSAFVALIFSDGCISFGRTICGILSENFQIVDWIKKTIASHLHTV